MFESLKKAIDEIFGSVIRPIKEWVLRQSWGVRVICLIVIAAAAFAWWKPQTVTGFYQQGHFYWRSWRSPSDKVPLSDGAQQSLALAIKRLAPSVEADLSTDLNQSSMSPWSASQAAFALGAAGQPLPDKDALVAYVNSRRVGGCFCWTELEEQQKPQSASFIGGWVMAAFAKAGAPAATEDFDYVLQHQNPAGWWPMFPESGASQYASTYSTAWLTLGLHEQRSAGLVPADKTRAVDGAIRRAVMWLMRSRQGARWKAHPSAPQTDTPDAQSGFVLHVLHQFGSLDLTDVDRAWLDALPQKDLDPSSLDRHYTILPYARSSAIDHFEDIRLPWILLATADAFPSGSVAQRARTLNWFENVLRNPEVRGADTQGFDWVRSELLIGIAEASKRTDCKTCQTGKPEARQGQ
jgi:hypothetical protein